MQRVSQLILRLMGWRITGRLPAARKFVVIVGPHTSNWDFVVCILVRSALAAKVSFLGKHQLFRFPFGYLLRAMGGRPVVRNRDNNLVDQVVALFAEQDDFVLGLAPEGTRSPVNRWKQGFYHIACAADVPIVMIGPDFVHKEVRIAAPFWPSGDIDADFPRILDYFQGIQGRHPKRIPPYLPGNS